MFIILALATNIFAMTVSSSGLVSLRYQTGQNLIFLNPGVKYPDAGFAAAYLMPELDLDQGGRFGFRFELYTGELSARTFSSESMNLYGVENVNDYFNDTYFVRKAYISIAPSDSLSLYIGQREIVGGSKLVFYNYQPSVTINYDMTNAIDVPLSLELNAVKVEPYKLFDPSRTSMFYDAEISYNFSIFEYITLFYSNFEDTDNTTAPLLNSLIYTSLFNKTVYRELVARYGTVKAAGIMACLQNEYAKGGPVYTSSGSINWFGITGNRYFGPFEAELTGILEDGSGSINGNNCLSDDKPFSRNFSTYGYLGDAKVKYHIKDKAAIGLFAHISSGDKTPLQAVLRQGTLNSFIALFPYNTETSLFFNGGINQNLNTGAISLAGRRGLGVDAYGGIIDVYPVNPVEFTITPAIFYPEVAGNNYGFETDSTFTYTLNRHVSFPFELDYFRLGKYFDQYSNTNIYQVLFGADISW